MQDQFQSYATLTPQQMQVRDALKRYSGALQMGKSAQISGTPVMPGRTECYVSAAMLGWVSEEACRAQRSLKSLFFIETTVLVTRQAVVIKCEKSNRSLVFLSNQ